MERMSTIDAVWTNAEGDGPPIAIGSLSVLDGPAPDLEELRALVAERIADAPRMRQRLAKDPLRLRQAGWEDTEVDLRWHVREWPVREPGDQAALEHAVTGLLRTPMHEDHPLWDMTVITGLADGSWGLVQRMHHSMADGQGSLLLTGRLVDASPSGGPTLTEALLAQMGTEAEPRSKGSRAFLAEAATKGGDLLLRALKTVTSTEQLETLASQLPQAPGLLAGDPGIERAWTQSIVPLSEVKQIRAALGGTVNDVVMALVSGGYRDLLQTLGKDPQDATVRVLVPVSLRSPGDLATNNQVGGLLVMLPLGGDTVTRFADIREHLDAVKEVSTPNLYSGFYAAVDATVPAFVQSLVVRTVGGKVGSLYAETLVTNVPGPSFPVYVAGRRARTMAPLIPLGEPLRITIGVVSYAGQLFFGITGGHGIEEDVHVVSRGIQAARADLLAAAQTVEAAEHR